MVAPSDDPAEPLNSLDEIFLQKAIGNIRNIRIYRAAELLQQPGVTVAEAAYQAGFESISYFSKAFREQMGVSPSDWAARSAPPCCWLLSSYQR